MPPDGADGGGGPGGADGGPRARLPRQCRHVRRPTAVATDSSAIYFSAFYIPNDWQLIGNGSPHTLYLTPNSTGF